MAQTQIVERQIADQAITAAKIKAGAGIESSKLQDGADFIKRNGSVGMTGNLDMGTQRILNVQTPSTGTDASNKNYVDTEIAKINGIFDAKQSARVASVANVTISNPGTAIFDDITLIATERILLKNQTNPQENGIYIFTAAGSALTRALDMDAWSEIPGAFLAVEEGTVNADTIWLCTANSGGTLETTAITWQQIPTSAGLLNSNFVDKEIPTGSINGANTTFTLANTPMAGSEHVFLNGFLQESGAGNDYTISGNTVTMLTAPLTGEKLRVSYRK